MAIQMPYIYNTNNVSRASLDKVKPIGDDLLQSKTDFSDLAEEENVNPLGYGQTKDFATVLDQQLQSGYQSAARLGLL